MQPLTPFHLEPNKVRRIRPHNTPPPSGHPQGSGLLTGLTALTGLIGLIGLGAPAVKAGHEYCNLPNPTTCSSSPNLSTADTYFWAPSAAPAASGLLNTINAGTALGRKSNKITLRSPSSWTLNASGSSGAEILIGSLGRNQLRGGGGGDTYVVGSASSVIAALPNCPMASGNAADCVIRQSPSSTEGDSIILDTNTTEVIYVNRCLQVTAIGTPGLGGNQLSAATAAPNNQTVTPPFPAYGATDAKFVASCPTPLAALRADGLRISALRGRDALLAPWERLGPASTALNRVFSWLEPTITALIQGPKALAGSASLSARKSTAMVPTFAGVPRLFQDGDGNFLRTAGDRGDIIVVDSGALTFNGQTLRSLSSVDRLQRQLGRVYRQLSNRDPIPLQQGIVFVYHQEMGILASYANDHYPYGTLKNPGTVIAQLVLRNGRALPTDAIDSVAAVAVTDGAAPTQAQRPTPPFVAMY
jgi:hypothetical protein